ncbi:hypothetical protein Tco_0153139 [Tanacetum coccineum]
MVKSLPTNGRFRILVASYKSKIPDRFEIKFQYDDEIPTKQVSQDIMQEVSLTIDEAKLKRMARELTNDEVEYLKLFEEEIEVRLKYRNQMRRWEMYVNGRPLGPQRERPE